MKKIYALVCFLVCTAGLASAQSKVFKEVNDEIATSMQAIIQDGALVGYLVFTQLEKANEDSFHYKLTIMDENLNDLGTVNFTDEKLALEAVSFEQDVLCVAYFKTNMIGKEYKNRQLYADAYANRHNGIMLQFLNLDGKVIKTHNINADVSLTTYNRTGSKITVTGSLKQGVQLRNIPQKGFVCLYSDDSDNPLVLFNTNGERLWKKKLSVESSYTLLTTTDQVFVLTNGKMNTDGRGYAVSSYGVSDSAEQISRFTLKDKQGNYLRVMAFNNDPTTGMPYVAGTIVGTEKKGDTYTGKGLSKGPYGGLFTIDFTGKTENDIKPVYTYWEDGSKEPAISKRGKYADNGAYMNYDRCIRDFQGNTYFVGSSVLKRVRWGSIAVSTLLLPTIIIGPIWLGTTGTHKYKIKDAMILKMDKKGTLNFDNTIDCNSTGFHHSKEMLAAYDSKRFFSVSNSATKANYVVVDDTKDIVIYNINQKKVARTISHKEGKSRFNIYPAKEGHIMVSEYNKKEKFTRLSIEAL